jgi:hypothetical protein
LIITHGEKQPGHLGVNVPHNIPIVS